MSMEFHQLYGAALKSIQAQLQWTFVERSTTETQQENLMRLVSDSEENSSILVQFQTMTFKHSSTCVTIYLTTYFSWHFRWSRASFCRLQKWLLLKVTNHWEITDVRTCFLHPCRTFLELSVWTRPLSMTLLGLLVVTAVYAISNMAFHLL